MKLFDREKRIKYLEFDDFWFMVIGILVLSLVTDYLFNDSFFRYPLVEAIIAWSISLFFTIVNWTFMREVMIYLRKKYPDLKDSIKRILRLFIILVVSVIVIDMLGNLLLSYIFGFNYNPLSRSTVLLPILIISTMVQAIYEAIYHFIKLKKSVKDEEQAKRMVVQVQLDALRNQAQPHFLFNTLNTLRDIIDQNSKDDAKVFVDKIANVYRFILESGNDDLIPLHNELKFAQSYIHIQSERFGENLQVTWDIPDLRMNHLVVPMSLQLLLENAIKHNVISRARPLHIKVKATDEWLVVSNKIQKKSSQMPSTGLGLNNIKKRYELIADKEPIIENDSVNFRVSVPLLKPSDQKKSYERIDY